LRGSAICSGMPPPAMRETAVQEAVTLLSTSLRTLKPSASRASCSRCETGH
jgi:hypothetical protein